MSHLKYLRILYQIFKYFVEHNCILFSRFLYENLWEFTGLFNPAVLNIKINTHKQSLIEAERHIDTV